MRGRRVVLAVSGGVAAYKSAYLARRLLEQGADVRVVMTPSSIEFIGPQTFKSITGQPVVTDLFSGISPHTELGQWAEVIVVAPATAHTLSKIAYGISGDPVATTVLASAAPLVVAPAMHTEMWEHPATVATMEVIAAAGHTVVGPEAGELAGGDVGHGRLSDPDQIAFVTASVLTGRPLTGRSVVVTAGGTREPIDPVRFIGNRSSGRMGHEVAQAAALLGADVTLVTASPLSADGVQNRVQVETAQQMADATWTAAASADAAILAAAVADFRPAESADTKLRRIDGAPAIDLVETPNVLQGVVALDPKPFVVGFAAQTGSLDDAKRKATEYGVDVLMANDVSKVHAGFGTETNEITAMWPDGRQEAWEVASKSTLAMKIMRLVGDALNGRSR